MELRQLEYFLMVSDLTSFTRAAERLYVSQPAVTNAVRSLEEELGIQLFDRSQRKVALTTEGKIFYRHIQNIMQGISTTLNEINDLKSHNRGHIVIGVTPLAGIASTSSLMAEFRAAYPNINISLVENNVKELLELLHADKLDFAFVFDLPEQEQARLSCLLLPQEELMVCCSRRHRLCRMNSVTLTSLTEEAFILMETNCLFRQILVKHFEDADSMPPVSMEVSQVQLLRALVAADAGLSILPECLITSDTELSAVPLAPPVYLHPVLAYKAEKLLSHAAQAFEETARKGVRRA
ncbi:LysR family transcriptional regulator [Selenomonas sp. TAMA-11512]|uniref:LysR family transcriptional regulator n=1 Tax=Selenomonas sp. TAMA-11512 TaxID=3095337 RepID=UPI0030D1B54C